MTEPTEPRLENAPAQDGAAPAQSLESLLAEAQAKIEAQQAAHEQQLDTLRRALADADNARKRAQAEIAAAGKYAVERLVADLLPVDDSLEAALAVQAGDDALRSGVELTLKQLRAALAKAKVAEIPAAPGDRFDPNHHQAMAAVESEVEPNTIVAVVQKGFLLHDRVVRPALVTVAKAVEKDGINPISDAGLASNQGN